MTDSNPTTEFLNLTKNNKENEVINHQNFLARTNDRNFSTIIKKESNYFWWNLSLKTDLTNQNVCLASSFMSVRPLVCDLPILRQQNDWAIGVGKWPFLLTFSMYRIVRGWVQKSPKMCWRIIWVVPMRTNLSIRRRDVASSRHNKSPCFLAAARSHDPFRKNEQVSSHNALSTVYWNEIYAEISNKNPKMCWRIIWVFHMKTNLSIQRRDGASLRHNKSPCFLAAARSHDPFRPLCVETGFTWTFLDITMKHFL